MARSGDIRTATASTTAFVLLGERKNRRAVILFAPVSGSYTVSDSPAITNGQGVYIAAGMPPVVLDYDTVGTLVTQPLYVIASIAMEFGIIEVTE